MTTTYAWGATGMRQIDDPEKVNVAFVQYEDFARAEAEVARLKDALRQANGVRDVFASAVVAQAMQDIDPAKEKP